MGLEVVDRHERNVPHQGECLGSAHADQEGTDQARTGGGCDRVDVASRHPRLGKRIGQHRHQLLDVGPSGDLGNHAAEDGVLLDLAGHDRGPHDRGPLDQGHRRLVARRLDAQDQVTHGRPPRPTGP